MTEFKIDEQQRELPLVFFVRSFADEQSKRRNFVKLRKL